MALPNITVPHFQLELPVSKQTVTFRPFLVKEEKILLIAREAMDEESITMAVSQILDSCVEGVDVNDLNTVDLEYLFLNIRAKSVGEEVELRYKHSSNKNRNGEDCNASTPVTINLEDVKVKFNDNHEEKIMITDEVGVKMKYPTFGDTETMKKDSLQDVVSVIAHAIDFIFDKEQIYDDTTTSFEEKIQFVENLNQEQLLKINNFFETMPKLEHEVTYQCTGCGQEDKLTLRGISDFF